MPFDRDFLRQQLAKLAAENVFIGTSSWKYPGWLNLLYEEQRYIHRGRFTLSRFEKNSLAEYAEVFKTVCVDAGYYRFPERQLIEGLVAQVPGDFQFSFKVTDDITVKRFTNQPRYGKRAGKMNENFLNADMFARAFLKPFEDFRENIGMVIFEFSRFYPSDYSHGREFVAELDRFLENIPKGWNYGIEIRNRNFLHPEYFSTLARHGVAHVFNSWSEMPPVSEQFAMPGSLTAQNIAARFLLKPGRAFQEAVELFRPYDRLKEPYPDAREAALGLIRGALRHHPRKKIYLYVNNRLEGNALLTVMAILEAMLK